MEEVKPGIYRHWKGKLYLVIGLVRNSVTEEKDTVLYVQLYGEHEFCVRPLEDFLATVENDGKKVPRFEYVGEK
jgi:hypothetical protein